MEPKEFLHLADELKNDRNKTEAKLRTSIGRSYYALYNLMKSCLVSLGFKISTGHNGHTEVKNCFSGCGIDSLAQIGSALGSLRSDRNKADYGLCSIFTGNIAFQSFHYEELL